jgi:hypothetical protein
MMNQHDEIQFIRQHQLELTDVYAVQSLALLGQ